MEHNLINTVVISFVIAFSLGLLAKKLRLSPILGYILAGVIVGPFTPGFVADISLAQQLAELGVILLMFGVGVHFSLKDLLVVWKLAIPGALFQMFIATGIGTLAILLMGYPPITAFIYGFSLSVASTIVLLRALEHQDILGSKTGKIAIGWLIVEDVAMVFALVLMPVIAKIIADDVQVSAQTILAEVLRVILAIGGFVVLMMVLGRKFLPWILSQISKTKSNELMTLGTLSIAMGFALLAYILFDASLALGAFLAGLVLSESKEGQRAAEKSLPMRDAFAVLFFVSVGMLFNPMTLVESPLLVLLTVFIIIVCKGLAALIICKLFKLPQETSLTIAIALAQIGEFSFILASIALLNGMLNLEFYNLILAGALISIGLNPFLFQLVALVYPALPKR